MNVHDPVSARWFHVVFNTYGTWLPGDPRGFRTRHHREHIDGDYKSPPPSGLYEKRHARSACALREVPRRFTKTERRLVVRALVERLVALRLVVAAAAVGREHVHLVLKCPPADVRHVVGLAKKHAWYVLRDHGHSGLVWARRSRAEPIRDRHHQLNAVNYVLRHADDGAAVWRYGDPIEVGALSDGSDRRS